MYLLSLYFIKILIVQSWNFGVTLKITKIGNPSLRNKYTQMMSKINKMS